VFLGLEEVEEIDEGSKGGVPLGEEGAYGGERDEGGGGDEGRVAAEDLCLCLDDVGMVLVCEDEAEGGAEGRCVARGRQGESGAGSGDVCVAEGDVGDGEQGVLLTGMEEGGKGRIERGVVEEKRGLVSGEEEEELGDHGGVIESSIASTLIIINKPCLTSTMSAAKHARSFSLQSRQLKTTNTSQTGTP